VKEKSLTETGPGLKSPSKKSVVERLLQEKRGGKNGQEGELIQGGGPVFSQKTPFQPPVDKKPEKGGLEKNE